MPPWWATIVAGVPLVGLAGLVFGSKRSLSTAAWVSVAVAALLALLVYDLDLAALAQAVGKGAWTGVWIVILVVPALALFEVSRKSSALEQLGEALQSIAPTDARRLLLLAWILPSFLQGVAGFGVPIVIAAPLLVYAGLTPVAAVAACAIGYHWSVTFGSMGSSFFIAAGTAQLDAADTTAFALKSTALLTVSALVAMALLLRRSSRPLEALLPALVVFAVMGAVLIGVGTVQPALGSTAAGLAGLLTAAAIFPARRTQPSWRLLLTSAAPYVALVVVVAAVFAIPWLRNLAGAVPEIAPSFGASEAAFGHVNAAVTDHRPLRPLLHAGPYLAAAALFAVVWYRRLGWWSPGLGRQIAIAWGTRAWQTSASIIGLTVLAATMVEAGMIGLLAQAATATLGQAFIVAAPALGAVGTVLTGSTTASNALLSPLQVATSGTLGVDSTTLLAAQTVGGNVGNSLTPLVVGVAAGTVGIPGREGEVIRRIAPDAAVLLLVVAAGTLTLAWLF